MEQNSALPSEHSASHSVLTVGGTILAIGGLYFGRELFIPFTLAALLSFALSPVVSWLVRRRMPRVMAVLLATALAFSLIGGLSYVVGIQLIKLADQLPTYRQTILEKIKTIQGSGTTGGSIVDRVSKNIEGLTKDLSAPKEPVASNSTAGAQQPVTVRIEPAARSPIDVLVLILGPIIGALATGGIVIVFVIFVLLEKEDLRDRFLKLVGTGDLHTSTQALSEAGSRVSRYLLMQLIVNVTYGVPIGLGLYFLGVPNAILWGLLAAVLRFIPYLGPFLAALFPLALAFAIDPGWSILVWVIGIFVVMELISNNVVEPWLYGASTGLSSLAILAAAIFWTSLWGPVGLVLATPLTVCLVVIGRYVPQLKFLEVLLGSEPVLKPEEQLYQRLLAGNVEGATEIAEAYATEHSSQEFYDQIAIPALRLAENDRQRIAADAGYKYRIAESMTAVVRETTHQQLHLSRAENKSAAQVAAVPRALGVPDLCIAGRTDLDGAAAEMVAQAAVERGIGARVLPPISVSQHGIGQLDLAGIEVVCLSYLTTEPEPFARFACRRLKQRVPEIKVIVCLWNPTSAHKQDSKLKERMGADAVVFTVGDAVNQIDAWVAIHISDPMTAAPTPDNEQERLDALRNLGLLTGADKRFDEVAAKVAAAFGTVIALVTLVDDKYQRWPGAVGLPPKLDACRMDARETSICGHVVAANEMLVIEDVSKDPRFANNPFLIENGIRFYAGAPLQTRSGHAIGSLCVIDTKPRSFDDRDRTTLRNIADNLMIRVEMECYREKMNPFNSIIQEAVPQQLIDAIEKAPYPTQLVSSQSQLR